VTSFILLMSSLTMVLALAAIQRGDERRLRIWLLATALFGLTFIGGQVYEFTHFYREGLSLSSNLFGSSFFTLTGLHGAHVTMGIVWLLALWGRSMQGKLPQHRHEAVEIAGLYWHFVDVVWIVIFTAIYLLPQG
jgi:cytochrome c oxidase subunit 3/cytochrome o ubiquinol oxidase subunit 3